MVIILFSFLLFMLEVSHNKNIVFFMIKIFKIQFSIHKRPERSSKGLAFTHQILVILLVYHVKDTHISISGKDDQAY